MLSRLGWRSWFTWPSSSDVCKDEWQRFEYYCCYCVFWRW